jgi:hypothetical protein
MLEFTHIEGTENGAKIPHGDVRKDSEMLGRICG